MTTSYCEGAKEVIIEWTHTEPDRIQPSGSANIYCPLNGGSLTHEWVENMQFRRYFTVGLFSLGHTNACGVESAFIAGYYRDKSLGLNFERIDNQWAIPVGGEGYVGYCYAAQTSKNDVDDLIASYTPTEEGYGIPLGDKTIANPPGILYGQSLYQVGSCSSQYIPNKTLALSIGTGYIFRSNNAARYYLSIRENEEEVHQYGSPDVGFFGSGQFNWDVPTRSIIYRPGYTQTRSVTIKKSSLSSVIQITTEPYNSTYDTVVNGGFYIGADRFRYNFTEILDGEETGREIFAGVLSGGVPLPEDIVFTCVEGCPPDTCAVDCGTHFCCYNSEGISVASFEK